jgi:ubiquinone/menaquinone biosynthesis C-methylase UbiE
MSLKNAFHSVFHLVHIYLISLINKEAFEVCEPFVADDRFLGAKGHEQWDGYWRNKRKIGGIVYDLIAAFYRKFIIKRCLNYFVSKYFNKGEEVLHAGCGSGQVDVDIKDRVSINALDISVDALSVYKKVNKNARRVIHGSLFHIPLDNEFVDGIYNLGVMEHFTESEIQEILMEFYRVLKPNGRMIIFWPPEFGSSVIFIKGVRFLLKMLFNRDAKIHPDEITLVQSKDHAKSIFKKANFAVIDYYFGMRDLFTHCVIVLAKRA